MYRYGYGKKSLVTKKYESYYIRNKFREKKFQKKKLPFSSSLKRHIKIVYSVCRKIGDLFP